MNITWDYTTLADAYLERPDYAPKVLEQICMVAGLTSGDRICDIGAGVAHLTIPFAVKKYVIDAVEPNDAMRAHGIQRTVHFPKVTWYTGTGEETGRPTGHYDFVSFGSSFNACEPKQALQETWRLLKPQKYFACLWNHRNLEDPLQASIEDIIKSYLPDYQYGTRRDDQSAGILDSGLFMNVQKIEGEILHRQPVEDVIKAWYSHATLQRQAGEAFISIVEAIKSYVLSLELEIIDIPYITRAWIAQRKDI